MKFRRVKVGTRMGVVVKVSSGKGGSGKMGVKDMPT